MSAIFTAFGIDWRLLVIDSINFGLLLVALWYFLYAPLTRILEERRQTVAQGVRDAEAAQNRLREIEASRSDVLAEAGKEADEVLARARTAASLREREMVSAGEGAAARLLSEAELQARDLKERAVADAKREVAKLVVLGLEKAMMEQA